MVINGYAQHSGSPYTILGVGALNDNAPTYNALKGGVGLSNGTGIHLNQLNPALLALNNFTIFDFGVQYDHRTIATDSLSQINKGGGLNYLSLAVPIKTGKIASSLTLSPYSTVKYSINSRRKVENDSTDVLYDFQGDGGINQVVFQTGVRVLKNLLVGGKVGYMFGSRNEETTITINKASAQSTGYYRVSNYGGFYFGLGAAYSYKLEEEKFLNIGVIYDFPASISTERTEYLGSGFDIQRADTVDLILDGVKGSTNIPQKFGVGISYNKELNYSIELNYYQQSWEDYSNFYQTSSNLGNSYKIALGGEITPDLFSVNNYLERVTYLLGTSFSKTPLTVENEDITDFGINFGVSLPVGNASTVNLGFTYGQMGKTTENLLKENYYKISLGISFNDRAYEWYRKQRKFN